jgi:hypothetical protein
MGIPFIIAPFIICGFIVFWLLIRLEYILYREKWELDGKPYSLFLSSRCCNSYKTIQGKQQRKAAEKLMAKWLFFTPIWIKNDKKAFCLVLIYRIFVFIIFAITIIAFVTFVLSIIAPFF